MNSALNITKENYMIPGNGKPWCQQYSINEEQVSDLAGWTTGTCFFSYSY
jgi:hypothetical protein